MRIGNNPNRGKGVAGYSSVVLTCVTHLPHQEGYHAGRLEVIQTCLSSMRREYDQSIIVWDNGSCDALRDWLQYEYKPSQLVLSENIGKNAARTCIARMLPPDRIMSYCDDDIYFYPGWLEPQLELLQHFPNVAAVSGYPVRTAFRWGCENTIAWARDNAKLKSGRYIPRAWENDFSVSIGRDPRMHEVTSINDQDYIIEYSGKEAYATAHHCQFISPVSAIGRIVNYSPEAMADEKPTDILLDKIGLRLCTIERYARHIGNVIDDKLRDEIETYRPADTEILQRLQQVTA